MNSNAKREKILIYVKWICVCMFFLILWTRVYPVMVGDPDDWTYISFSRQAIPAWKAWNPAKVFPETFMGLCGNFAALIVYPIINDYQHAMTYTFATVIAIVITIYLYMFDKMIGCLFRLSRITRFFVVFFFVCSHFWVFKVSNENNPYMFMSPGLNLEMNYRVPMFATATLLFYEIVCYKRYEKLKISGSILLWLYLCLFSNMATNVVIVIPTFIHFVYKFICWKRNHQGILKFIQTVIFHIIVFAMEIVVLFFEYFGGRASSLEFCLEQAVSEMVGDLKTVYLSVNFKFALIVLILVGVALILSKKRKVIEHKKMLYLFLLSGIFSSVYVILLFIRVGKHKITRPDNLSVMALFFVIVGSVALACIFEQVRKMEIMIPIMIYIMLFSVCNVGRMYGNYFESGGNLYHGTHAGYDTNVECYEANKDIIDQFIAADSEGVEEFDLYAPNCMARYEWAGARVETTLYRQGIIKKHMVVHIYEK